MSVKKKVADFIRLEEGNIGKHAATITGALLASTVLGAVLTQPVYALPCCHDQSYPHQHSHTDSHSNSHYNNSHYNKMDPGYNCTWCGPQ